jgi:hypothetical protein
MSESKVTVRQETDRKPKHAVYPYVWSGHYYTHCERQGQRCRVWARGTMDSIGVEFDDGFRTVTARWAIGGYSCVSSG